MLSLMRRWLGRPDNGDRDPDRDEDEGGGSRRALILAVLALPVLILFYTTLLYWSTPRTGGDQLTLTQFNTMLDQGRISNATVLDADNRVVGSYDRGRYWVAYPAAKETVFAQLVNEINQAGVPLEINQQSIKRLIQPLLLIVPALIVVDGILIAFIFFQDRGSIGGGFSRSGVRRFGGESKIGFDDVAGLEEAIEELAEIRDYLDNPDRFMAMGAAVPKGILLTGPPGCGKTLLARAVAGESDVPYFSISGSDFVEMFVGVGAARIRDLFQVVKDSAPAIVFIDELDAVGRGRTANAVGGQDEREATLNQLLVEMDGFESGSGVVVLAATNRADIIDSALMRPGRFDRRIPIDRPDVKGRKGILKIHSRGKPLAEDVDLAKVAERTAGFSGADLANVVNEGALLAARHGDEAIELRHLFSAVERVMAGPERRSRVISDEDRRRIAVHEAGHAVASAALPSADPARKVSIISRGHAAGYTWIVPDKDRVVTTRSQMLDRIVALISGRAAEELLAGEVSSGSETDLDKAAKAARAMVARLGMSEGLGPLAVSMQVDSQDDGLPWHSEELRSKVDDEVRRILEEAERRARELLRDNREVLEELSDQLGERESIEGEALRDLLARVRPARRAVRTN